MNIYELEKERLSEKPTNELMQEMVNVGRKLASLRSSIKVFETRQAVLHHIFKNREREERELEKGEPSGE